MRPNWSHGRHPPACTCDACDRNRRSGINTRQELSRGSGREERIHEECEAYLAKLCAKFGVRVPLLVFDDNLENPGACGEAGQSTVWIQRHFALTANKGLLEAVLRHELAHISINGNPAIRDVATHGPEFEAELDRISEGRVPPVLPTALPMKPITPVRDEVGWFKGTIGFLAVIALVGWLSSQFEWSANLIYRLFSLIGWATDHISRLLLLIN